jgi:hypothetical protein
MADRRTDETPLAPRRSLAGSSEGQTRTSAEKQSGSDQQKRSGSNSNSNSNGNQQNGSGNAQQQRPGSTPQARTGNDQRSGATGEQRSSTTTESRTPLAGRVNEKVSGAVTAATETVRKVKESRSDERKPSATTTAGRPASRPSGGTSRPRTRKARLRMTHVDPWSVMKTAFLLSIALGIVTVIAVAMVWSVLGAAGVWDSINQTVQEVVGGQDGTAFDVENYVGASRVLGFTMIVAVVDVVLITAIATLGAFLYNLAATLLGGIEVTLAEEEH